MNTSDTGQEQRPIYMLEEADLEAVTGGSAGRAAELLSISGSLIT